MNKNKANLPDKVKQPHNNKAFQPPLQKDIIEDGDGYGDRDGEEMDGSFSIEDE